MKLFTIVGARPQFVKVAALTQSLRDSSLSISQSIIHTGQHYDPEMSDRFFSELSIDPPYCNLGIGGGTHGSNTGQMLERLERLYLDEKPNGVLVFGDTDSTLAGALAASKIHIPIFHVEAGLRSFNRVQPEEQNRVLTDHLSDLCFAPTSTSVTNLLNEGIPIERVVKCGDVMLDAARIFGDVVEQGYLPCCEPTLTNGQFILATIHRSENVDNYQRLEAIFTALSELPLPVFMPLHPRTKARLIDAGLSYLCNRIQIVDPIGFLDMIYFIRHAQLVITDSGGLQKEAYMHSTPCVTPRMETEWTELLETEWNILADPNSAYQIKLAVDAQLSFDICNDRPELYGDGFSCNSIIQAIANSIS